MSETRRDGTESLITTALRRWDDDQGPTDRDDPRWKMMVARASGERSTGAPLRPDAIVVSRELAAAAASTVVYPSRRLTSDDGRIVTDVEESDEGALLVTFTATDAPSMPLLSFHWSVLVEGERTDEKSLVTPLGPAGEDGARKVRYELGSVTRAQAFAVSPPEWISVDELDPLAVAATLRLGVTGAANRAWCAFLDTGEGSKELRASVVDGLQR